MNSAVHIINKQSMKMQQSWRIWALLHYIRTHSIHQEVALFMQVSEKKALASQLYVLQRKPFLFNIKLFG